MRQTPAKTILVAVFVVISFSQGCDQNEPVKTDRPDKHKLSRQGDRAGSTNQEKQPVANNQSNQIVPGRPAVTDNQSKQVAVSKPTATDDERLAQLLCYFRENGFPLENQVRLSAKGHRDTNGGYVVKDGIYIIERSANGAIALIFPQDSDDARDN